MARVVLTTIEAGLGSADTINSNFQALAEALEDTLSRSGEAPNQMEADLDLNGRTLLNSGTSDDPGRVVTYSEMTGYISSHSTGLVAQRMEAQVATAAQTLFVLNEMSYSPGDNSLAVYVDGVRKFSPGDYTELSSTEILFTVGLSAGQDVQFVANEFLSTVTFPQHTHPWTQITNVPEYTTRWPTYAEVTDKPTTFAPSSHTHSTSEITSGRLADAQRGVWVQAAQPSSPTLGDLWAW